MPWFEHTTSRIWYEEQGSGDPVLILPGFSGSIDEFGALRGALEPRYRVIAADLPGSGRSEPQPRAYPPTYYADDAQSFAALLDHLQAGPAHVVGFSDGGEVALLMAVRTPERVRSLAIWGAAGAVPEAMREGLASLETILDSPGDPFGAHLRAAYGDANARATLQNFIRATHAIIDSGGDISLSRISDITCPVLIMAGDQDFIAPPAVAADLAARMPIAEVQAVNGAGHALHQERPEWFLNIVRQWIETH